MLPIPYLPETTAPKATPAKTPEPVPSKPMNGRDETPSLMFWIEALLHVLWVSFTLINFVMYAFRG